MGEGTVKDHNYIKDDGSLVPVSEMDIADIRSCLDNGLEIHNVDGETPQPEDVMERLRIELLIRELGL